MTNQVPRWRARPLIAAAIVLTMLVAAMAEARAGTLGTVKQRGHLICGVSEGLAGFSAQIEDKTWRGFDVDFCRAVAAAIFGEPGKVSYMPLSALERFDALRSGKIDLLSRNTTWTLGRDVALGLDFVGISYHDGQGFLTRVEKGLSSALQLTSAKVCILSGTTSIDNAKAYFARHGVVAELVEFAKRADALAAYAAGDCDVYSGDRSALASERTRLKDAGEHMLLPEVISKELLGPVVRQDDPAWTELVRWVLFLLINAEEAGWTAADAAKQDGGAGIAVPDEVSGTLGLDRSWARTVVAAVGNYGEIFERNVGRESPLRIDRGINALWVRGGILYAPPMR